MQSALSIAQSGGIAILGITPSAPETGYGYIKTQAQRTQSGDGMIVERFVEKPDLATATQYLKEGNLLWLIV